MHKSDPYFLKLLRDMQAVEFALVEIQYYLDIHPNDSRATNDFNYLSNQLHCLKHEYEQKYGTLFHFGLSPATQPSSWVEGPWPWEIDYGPIPVKPEHHGHHLKREG